MASTFRFTNVDLESFPDPLDDTRYELIDGGVAGGASAALGAAAVKSCATGFAAWRPGASRERAPPRARRGRAGAGVAPPPAGTRVADHALAARPGGIVGCHYHCTRRWRHGTRGKGGDGGRGADTLATADLPRGAGFAGSADLRLAPAQGARGGLPPAGRRHPTRPPRVARGADGADRAHPRTGGRGVAGRSSPEGEAGRRGKAWSRDSRRSVPCKPTRPWRGTRCSDQRWRKPYRSPAWRAKPGYRCGRRSAG